MLLVVSVGLFACSKLHSLFTLLLCFAFMCKLRETKMRSGFKILQVLIYCYLVCFKRNLDHEELINVYITLLLKCFSSFNFYFFSTVPIVKDQGGGAGANSAAAGAIGSAC